MAPFPPSPGPPSPVQAPCPTVPSNPWHQLRMLTPVHTHLSSHVVLLTPAKPLQATGLAVRDLSRAAQRPTLGSHWPWSQLEGLRVSARWVLGILPHCPRAQGPLAPAALLPPQSSRSAGTCCAACLQGCWACMWEGGGCGSLSKCISLLFCFLGRNSTGLGCFLPDPSPLPQCCPS